MTKEIHIALTGHRPNKLGGYDIQTEPYQKLQADLEQYIRFQLETYQTIWCHSGLALSADTIWSKAILSMRETYPVRVKFHAEIPMTTQSSRWFKADDINFWTQQVEAADETTLYSEQTEMTNYEAAKALDDRNIGMIDNADILLALWNGTSGGTKNAVDYATKINKPVVQINPNKYLSITPPER